MRNVADWYVRTRPLQSLVVILRSYHCKELAPYSIDPESRVAENEIVRITFYKEHLHCVMESKLELDG